ncbi:DUF6883 domain-containing protein [Phormidesmis priestleyi]
MAIRFPGRDIHLRNIPQEFFVFWNTEFLTCINPELGRESMLVLPQDAIITEEKLTKYLLVLLPKDDKSQFLARSAYTLDNWQQLEQDLRTQVLTQPAELIETNRYGEKYAIRARLRGSNSVELKILTIWIVTNGIARFVTLVPDKGANL